MKVRRTWLDVRELADRRYGRGYADLAQLSKVWWRERYRDPKNGVGAFESLDGSRSITASVSHEYIHKRRLPTVRVRDKDVNW